MNRNIITIVALATVIVVLAIQSISAVNTVNQYQKEIDLAVEMHDQRQEQLEACMAETLEAQGYSAEKDCVWDDNCDTDEYNAQVYAHNDCAEALGMFD
jgi:uncharacterized protein (DUF2141 family)